MKKKRGPAIFLAGIILTVSGLMGRMVVTKQRNEIVVYKGIATFRTYLGIVNTVLVVGLLLSVIGIIVLIASRNSRKADEKNKETIEKTRRQKKKSYSPEDIRENIRTYQKEYPEFPLDLCLQQLDEMDTYQSKLRELLDSNDLEAFAYTEDILMDVEIELCRDIKSFTNYMIVSADPNVTMDRYKSMLARNEERACSADAWFLIEVESIDVHHISCVF